MSGVSESSETRPDKYLLLPRILNVNDYCATNEAYVATLPTSHMSEVDGTIYDFEPHCAGQGCYDDPDNEPFHMFSEEFSWSRGEQENAICLKVTSCHQLIDLATFSNDEEWSLGLESMLQSPSCSTASFSPRDVESTRFAENIILDCDDWERCSEHYGRCMSAALLSFMVSFPQLKALKIRKLNWLDTSMFATFPSPTPLLLDRGYDSPPVVSDTLETLWLHHCHVPSDDVLFMTDCAIEHKVLPNLRNVRFHYCQGMSYSSISSTTTSALNVNFDRWEMSGWCWPQECVNVKNRNKYM